MPDLLASSPALSVPLPKFNGVRVEELRELGLATLMVMQGQYNTLVARAREVYGVELPAGPARVTKDKISFIGTGAGTWLAVGEGGGTAFAAGLAQSFEGVATVSDQSSGYCVLRLSGPRARAVLQSGVPVDLHPAVFDAGSAAQTAIAHIGVIFWETEDEEFEIAFFRSMADSFAHWLKHAAMSV